MGGPSRPRRSGKRKRIDSPIDHRYWAREIEKAEEISKELVKRITAVDELVKPYVPAVHNAGTPLLWPATAPDLPRFYARRLAANRIASYWAEHPHKVTSTAEYFFPPMVATGAPWHTPSIPPDSMHVFDLLTERLLEAWHKGVGAEFDRNFATPDADGGEVKRALKPEDGLRLDDRTVQLAIDQIRLDAQTAWLNPVVQGVGYCLSLLIRFGATEKTRYKAAHQLGEMLRHLGPKLSKHVEQTPASLIAEATSYQELKKVIGPVYDDVRKHGPTSGVRAGARRSLGSRIKITKAILRRWENQSLDEVVAKVLGYRWTKLEERLERARKARAINEAWADFGAFLREEPEDPLHSLLPPESPSLREALAAVKDRLAAVDKASPNELLAIRTQILQQLSGPLRT